MAFSSIHQCVMMAARYNIPMSAEHTEYRCYCCGSIYQRQLSSLISCEIISQPVSLYKNLTWAHIMWHAAATSQLPAADCNTCGLMHTESALL